LPNANKLIDVIWVTEQGAEKLDGKLGNARGALFELYKGVIELSQAGSTIVRFRERIKKIIDKLYDFEYNVVTTTKLIECKNWDIFSNRRFEALMEGINNRKMVAELAGKAFELCFSKPIPKEAAEKIIKIGIEFTITEMKL